MHDPGGERRTQSAGLTGAKTGRARKIHIWILRPGGYLAAFPGRCPQKTTPLRSDWNAGAYPLSSFADALSAQTDGLKDGLDAVGRLYRPVSLDVLAAGGIE